MLGITRTLKLLDSVPTFAPDVRTAYPASPWASNSLEQIALGDVFGVDTLPVTRSEAMSVPAVANARWLICNVLSRHPLKAYRGDVELDEQPAWLYRTNSTTPPQFRMMWTLDDLLFTGYSLWAVQRGARGRILDAVRVPLDWWEFDADWQVVLKGTGQRPRSDEVILFTSPMDPLLKCAARTIRAARNLEETWSSRVRDPIPTTLIKQVEDIELEEGTDDYDEAQNLIDTYVAARRKTTGSVAFVPYGYELEEFGTVNQELFVQGRNAVVLDVARFTALPPQLLGRASPASASLTYTTSESGRSELVDFSLAGWASAIEARLSLDDCVPAGQSVRLDISWLVTTPTPDTSGPPVED